MAPWSPIVFWTREPDQLVVVDGKYQVIDGAEHITKAWRCLKHDDPERETLPLDRRK